MLFFRHTIDELETLHGNCCAAADAAGGISPSTNKTAPAAAAAAGGGDAAGADVAVGEPAHPVKNEEEGSGQPAAAGGMAASN